MKVDSCTMMFLSSYWLVHSRTRTSWLRSVLTHNHFLIKKMSPKATSSNTECSTSLPASLWFDSTELQIYLIKLFSFMCDCKLSCLLICSILTSNIRRRVCEVENITFQLYTDFGYLEMTSNVWYPHIENSFFTWIAWNKKILSSSLCTF